LRSLSQDQGPNSGEGRAHPETARDAADAHFKAVQEERVVRGEPSDRFNVVQEKMAESRQNYEMLKELLKNEDFRTLSEKVLEARTRLLERGGGT
jgi:hypothetical protein